MCENFENFNSKPETEGDTVKQSVPPMGFVPFFNSESYEEYKERKELKRLSNAAGLGSSLLFVFSLLIGVGFSIIALLFMGEKSVEFVNDPAIMQAVQVVFSLFSFTLPFVIIYKAFGFRISELVSLSRIPKGKALPLLAFGLGACAFANIGASFIDNFFKSFGIDYGIGDIAQPDTVWGFLIVTVSTAVVPALVEEFAMRGIVLGSLRRFGDTFALIVSSLIFGLMHGNFAQIPFAFMVGLFLGFTVIKTGSLRLAIIIHFINNFTSVVFSYLPKAFSNDAQNILYVIYLSFCLLAAILFLKNEQDGESLFSLEDEECKLKTKDLYKEFFKSVGMIIFLVISLLQAVIYIFV